MALPRTFASLDEPVKDVLVGTKRKEGIFRLQHALTASTVTADGIQLNYSAGLSAARQPMLALTAAVAPSKTTVLTCTASGAGVVSLSATAVSLGLPGLTTTASLVPPNWGASQVVLDYGHPAARLTATIAGQGMKSAPLVNLAATTPLLGDSVTLGAQVAGNAAAGRMTSWALGASWAPGQQKSQIGAVLSGNGAQSFRLFGQQAVGEEGRTSFAFEYSQGLQGLLAPLLGSPAAVAQPAAPGAPATNDAAFTVGLAHRLDTGALAKAKVDHKGALSILYEGRLNEQARLTLSTQVDLHQAIRATPKLGIAVDPSP